MSITRDPSVRPEIAELMAAFNKLADGYDVDTVVNASLHMLAATIASLVTRHGWSPAEADLFTASACDLVLKTVHENIDRTPQPGDIPVNPPN